MSFGSRTLVMDRRVNLGVVVLSKQSGFLEINAVRYLTWESKYLWTKRS